MERKIGEVFEYQGKKLKVVEIAKDLCFDCYFFDGVNCQRTEQESGECSICNRDDYKSVIFVEVKDEQPQEQVEQPQGLNLCEILKDCPNGEPFWSPLLGDVKLYCTDQEAKKVVVTAVSNVNWNINADGTIPIESFTSPEVMLYPSKEQRDWAKVKYEKKKEKFDPKTLKAYDKVLVQDDGLWNITFFAFYNEMDKMYICSAFGIYKHCIPYNDDTKHLVGTKDEAPEYYRYWED